jgi:hypothetical protein
VFSTTLVVYAVLGYFYVLHSFITLVGREFRRSKFVDILEKLIRIREDEEIEFQVRMCSTTCVSVVAVFCIVQSGMSVPSLSLTRTLLCAVCTVEPVPGHISRLHGGGVRGVGAEEALRGGRALAGADLHSHAQGTIAGKT